MKKLIPIATLLFNCIFINANAQNNKPLLSDNQLKTKVDSAVDKGAKIYMDTPNAVGLSIGIYKDGKAYTYNYGEIKKGTGKLPTADNFYNLGSVAKTFVTTMLAEAVVEGKAKLNDDIRKYLPGSYPNLQFNGQPIRLINLANHTSGLPGQAHIFPKALKDSLRKLSLPD